jgi:hypothetical protein
MQEVTLLCHRKHATLLLVSAVTQPQHTRTPRGDETIVDADIVLDESSKGKQRSGGGS